MFFKALSAEEIDRTVGRADGFVADGQFGFARLEYLKALRAVETGHRAEEIRRKLSETEQQLVQQNLERYQRFMDAGDTASAVEALETALPLAREGSDQYWNLMKLYEQAEAKERIEDLSEELKIWIDQGVEPGVQFADRHRKWMMALTGASPFDDRLDHSESIVSEELLPLYQKVIDEPENADARYNLGLTLAQYGLMERATAQFRKYVALKPEDPEGFFILANVLADRGRFEDALLQFERTLSLSAGYQPAYFYMAEIYEKNDDVDEAARLYRIVSELDPKTEFAEEARIRLEEVLR